LFRATASFAFDLVQSMPRAASYLGGIVREAARPLPRSNHAAYQLRIITEEQSLRDLASSWRALHERSGSRSPFMSFAWLCAWWTEIGSAQGAALRILAVEHEGTLVGLGAFYLTQDRLGTRLLRLLGDTLVGSDYLDILLDPAHASNACDVLVTGLRGLEDVDGVELHDIDASSPFLSAISGTRDALPGFEVWPAASLPIVVMGGSSQAFHAQLSSNMRYNLKRKWRRLTKRYPDAHVRWVTRQDEIPQALDVLFDLHRRRWVARGMTGNFVRDEVRSFHRLVAPALLDSQTLRLYCLTVGPNRVIATIYCLRFGGREFYLQAGMDPSQVAVSPGFCLMKDVIERCAEDGLFEFDMLRGDESYKTHWARSEHETVNVRFARPTARGLLFATSGRARREMLHMIKRRLPASLVDEVRALTA
jgi:CelD/BcsL family acetyltransferase involved in cellulose biosynthesis